MFFARTGIEPLEIVYEELATDAQAAVDLVATAIGVAPRPIVDLSRIELRVQRDKDSDAWRDRFISECGESNYLDSIELLSISL